LKLHLKNAYIRSLFRIYFYNKSTVRNFFDFTLPKIFSDNNQNIKISKNFYINILKNKEKTIIILFLKYSKNKFGTMEIIAKIIQQLNVLWNGYLTNQFQQIVINHHYCTKFSTNHET